MLKLYFPMLSFCVADKIHIHREYRARQVGKSTVILKTVNKYLHQEADFDLYYYNLDSKLGIFLLGDKIVYKRFTWEIYGYNVN